MNAACGPACSPPACDPKSARREHVRIAEDGKRRALAGEHREALERYREALRLAVAAAEPEVFFRHYLECALESLERLGAYAEVLAYCDRAIEHYRATPPRHELALADLAHVHQRRGIILLKQRDPAGAAAALSEAARLAGSARCALPLTAGVLEWLNRGWQVDPERLLAEQERQRYFSVRPGALRPPPADPISPAAVATATA